MTVPLVVDDTFNIDMLLSGYDHSIVRQEIFDTLPHLFRPTRPGRFEMGKITFGREALLDLEVRISRQVQRLGADGILGMDSSHGPPP